MNSSLLNGIAIFASPIICPSLCSHAKKRVNNTIENSAFFRILPFILSPIYAFVSLFFVRRQGAGESLKTFYFVSGAQVMEMSTFHLLMKRIVFRGALYIYVS
jgi:hypothetical protein